ncbi:arsenate reductase ArsC [Coprobacillus cateniformis]|nr:arsenate reductase ArsC [Coprobacillus cateniformis]
MKKKIAFVCVHNSCRSQIAEALGNQFLSDKYQFYSCGTQIKSQINQDAVRLMKEKYGIDMEKTQYSKLVKDIPVVDITISMGCDVECPYIGRDFDDNWQLDDPTGKDDIVFKRVIEQIEKKIKSLND